MKCIYCQETFKLVKLPKTKTTNANLQKESNVCLDCSGAVDDLQIPDEELEIDKWKLRNPSGKVAPVFYDSEDSF